MNGFSTVAYNSDVAFYLSIISFKIESNLSNPAAAL